MKNRYTFLISLIFLYLLLGLLKIYLISQNLRFFSDRIFLFIYSGTGLALLLIYFILKFFKYRGSYTIFAAVFFLISTGFIIQYSIDSRIIPDNYDQAYIKDSDTQDEFQAKYTKNLYEREVIIIAASLIVFLLTILVFSRGILILYNRYLLFAVFTIVGFFFLVMYSESGAYGGRFFNNMTPWEVFKITLVIVISGYLYDYGSDLNKTKFKLPAPPVHSLGPLILLWAIPLLFLIFIHDFGQLSIYSLLAVIMIFYASKRVSYIILSLLILVLFSAAIIYLSEYLPGDLKYINRRFDTWSHFWDNFPEKEKLNKLLIEENPAYMAWRQKNWQILNSFFAINEGGILGKGFGLGNPNVITFVKNDFVFAAVMEEI